MTRDRLQGARSTQKIAHTLHWATSPAATASTPACSSWSEKKAVHGASRVPPIAIDNTRPNAPAKTTLCNRPQVTCKIRGKK